MPSYSAIPNSAEFWGIPKDKGRQGEKKREREKRTGWWQREKKEREKKRATKMKGRKADPREVENWLLL